MFAITRPSLLRSTDSKHFYLQKLLNNFVKTFNSFRYDNFLYLSTYSQRFASSASFNVIEMV